MNSGYFGLRKRAMHPRDVFVLMALTSYGIFAARVLEMWPELSVKSVLDDSILVISGYVALTFVLLFAKPYIRRLASRVGHTPYTTSLEKVILSLFGIGFFWILTHLSLIWSFRFPKLLEISHPNGVVNLWI